MFKCLQMILPIIVGGAHIVNIDVTFVNTFENIFHNFLCKVRKLLDAHQEAIVLEFAKWSGNNAKILGWFAQFKSVVLHGNVHVYVKYL